MRKSRFLGILLAFVVVAFGAWRMAGADSTPFGGDHPAHAQVKQVTRILSNSEAEHAMGAYIPGIGAVFTVDLVRGPNAPDDEDSSPENAVRDWAIYLMLTFGPRLEALSAEETIALSIDYYDYEWATQRHVAVTAPAATIADAGSYAYWLDGRPFPNSTVVESAEPAPVEVVREPSEESESEPEVAETPEAVVDAQLNGWQPLSGTWEETDEGVAQTEQGLFDLIMFSEQATGDRYTVTTEMKYIAGEMGGGLIFNAAQSNRKAGAQMVSFTANGSYMHWGRFDDNGIFVFEGGATTPNSADGNWHTLSVDVRDETYAITLNGDLIATGLALDTHPDASTGLIASTSHVAFRNFAISQVDTP